VDHTCAISFRELRESFEVISFYLAVTTVLGLEEGKDCVLVGTLFKHMKLKPSILDEYSKEVI
jgi:DNA polymerase delta subunit 2